MLSEKEKKKKKVSFLKIASSTCEEKYKSQTKVLLSNQKSYFGQF